MNNNHDLIYFDLDKNKFKQNVKDNFDIKIIKNSLNGVANFLCDFLISCEKQNYYFDKKHSQFFSNDVIDENFKIFIDFFSP